MFLVVLPRARTVAALIAVAAAAPASAATTRPPTAAQIRTEVRAAERSRSLWATVNICDTKRHPDTIGIRGQMPSLDVGANLSMDVQINYWSFSESKFVPDPGVSKTVALGDPPNRLIQGGVNFRFAPPVVLSGTVTFEWKVAGKVVGRAVRFTGRDANVEGGDPPGYSAPDCEMK